MRPSAPRSNSRTLSSPPNKPQTCEQSPATPRPLAHGSPFSLLTAVRLFEESWSFSTMFLNSSGLCPPSNFEVAPHCQVLVTAAPHHRYQTLYPCPIVTVTNHHTHSLLLQSYGSRVPNGPRGAEGGVSAEPPSCRGSRTQSVPCLLRLLEAPHLLPSPSKPAMWQLSDPDSLVSQPGKGL